MTEENKNLTTTITESDDLTQKSDAQEIATFAEKAKAAVVTVEKERDEYRRLYVAANGEVLGLKQEIRHLKDRLANRETENLRQTTMERERMNIQMQKDASSRELESLMTGSFQQLIQNKKK
ncbi:protein of unknown function [endosymbiont DhMRE of Dentiscutata heterogama]|uniref:hypothetical protein n=1 Tax=endosymbiont DhMRE of Dentiscutata heterogama TaxID=1609546 RepID=UPI000629DAFA|nr:hypothetical protein [endosymbiont DhMRE of Dentiscutata heterogama]CFW93314.1 protein of unknown function [endosymbiont DhMRE of Dentiscutata heterogama]